MKALIHVMQSSLATDKKIKLLFWWLFSGDARRYIAQVKTQFDAAELSDVLALHPFIFYMFRAHAFLLKGHSDEDDIFNALLAHYLSLSSRLKSEVVFALYADGWQVFQQDFDDLKVRLVLQYDHRMRFEGQLSLKLLLNNDEAYFINFVLDGNTVKVAGIQGVKDNKGLYKIFTKQLHGLRPQNFIWMAFLDWCKAVGVQQVLGVRPEWHVYQNETKSVNKIGFDYETFWQEVGGIAFDDVWYVLPINYPHKPIEEIESKKRSMYRKRYALLDTLNMAIKQEVSLCPLP
jgi:uncharacterized protein VirK/YbjX